MKRLAVLLFAVMCVFCAESSAQNYAAAVNYGTQLQPLGIVTGDFNRDGNPDVIATNFGSASLSFYPGNGDGTLGIPTGVAVGAHPNFTAAADFNGDGILDVAVSLANGQSFQVLLGNGNGTFQPPVTIAVPGLTSVDTLGQIVAADLNGDHRADVVIATSRGAAVFMNSGAGNFTESSNLDPGQQISSVAIADVNHDSRPDVIGVEAGSDSLGNPVGNVFLTAGNGDGSFAAMVSVRQFIGSPAGLAVGDINNDGLLDIVAANSGATLDGGGGGGFPGGCGDIRICPPVEDPPPPQPITVPGSILVLLQQGDGTFSLGNNLRSDPSPSDLLLGDFNGDGDLDIADASASSPALILFLGQGNGAFAAGISLQLPFAAAQIGAGPLTNTNALDLAVTEPGGNVISVFVNQGANSLTLSSSPNPSGVSQSVALTATVHPKFSGTANGSGSVIFADGSQTLGTAPVNASGTSNLTTSFSSAGTHPILAVFSGSATLVGGSSARINQTVNRGVATVTLTSSANPASFGQAIVFDVSVSSGGTGPVPTGTINLSNGSSILISGSLDSAGRLSLSTSKLPIGTTTLTAQYSGDQNYTPSNSSPLTETITKGTVTVTASSSSNPSVFGQAASLVVHVASSSGGPAIPTGAVTLFDGTSSQASLPLDANGAASFSLATLNAGTHSLTVNYSGDTSFSPSSSSAVSQVINKSDTATSLATSPSSSVFGQAIQITATVQASGSGAGVPSGSVVFSDGATSLGSAVLNNGKATFSTSALGVGSHNISASYSGDGNFNSSSASGVNGVTQAVAKSGTSTAVTGSPNPSVFGQAVILNATVAASGGGGGSPTGVLTFSDGTVSLGTVPIAAGAASLSVTSLAPGSHSITASYAGDANFTAGSSNPYSQVVNKAVTGTFLASSINPATVATAVTLSATVTAGAAIPSGSVAFFDGAQQIGSGQLDSSGKSVLPISNLSLGSHSFTAAYSGNSNFAASLSTALSETVVDSHSTVALTSSANPQVVAQPVTFVATVSPALGGPLNIGVVIFSDGTQHLAAIPVVNSIASFTTTTLTAGNHQITANYQAASTPGPFDGTSTVLTEVINPPNVGNKDFTMSIQQPVAYIRDGQSFTTKLILTPVNGLTGFETSICLGAPRGAVCTITPERATFNGKTTIIANVRISTTGTGSYGTGYRNGGREGGPLHPQRPLRSSAALALSSLFAFGCVFLGGFKKQRVSLLTIALLAGALTGCGGSGQAFRPPVNTPPGTYMLTVQSQHGSLVHSKQIELIVR